MLDSLVAEARLRWGLDPAAGLAIVPAERLTAYPIEPTRPAIVVPLALMEGVEAGATPPAVPGRHGHPGEGPLGLLARLYPPGHPVGRFGGEMTTVAALADADLLGPLYFAPVAPESAPASAWSLPWISSRLRAPDGCPWDREQTHESLRGHLLEEAYEVYDAMAGGATPELAGELGDLWLQVVLNAQLAAEAGVFDLADVHAAIAAKIVRRHPHVFGDAEVRTAGDVNRQWERIKADERAEELARSADAADPSAAPGADRGPASAGAPAAAPAGPRSALDGIGRTLPALAASQEMQERAAHIGYDWPSVDGVLEKVAEELAELAAAADQAERDEELGDLLMVVVNLARHHGVQAEASLRAANEKFRRRFGAVERLAAARGVALRDLTFAQLDELWDEAKALERAGELGQPAATASMPVPDAAPALTPAPGRAAGDAAPIRDAGAHDRPPGSRPPNQEGSR